MRQTTWLGRQRNLKPEVSLKAPLGNPTRPFSLFLRTTSVEWSVHQGPEGQGAEDAGSAP